MEVSEAQLKTMTGDNAKIHGINPKYSRQRRDKSFESQRKQSNGRSCGKCGFIHADDKCPAKENVPKGKSDTPLKSYSGHPNVVLGTVVLPVTCKSKTYNIKFYVVDVKASPVLSTETCRELNLFKRVHEISKESPDAKEQLTKPINLKDGYAELCEGLGYFPGEYSIQLQPDGTPVVHPPRKVPISLKDSITVELDRMEAEGVVVKISEPTK